MNPGDERKIGHVLIERGRFDFSFTVAAGVLQDYCILLFTNTWRKKKTVTLSNLWFN